MILSVKIKSVLNQQLWVHYCRELYLLQPINFFWLFNLLYLITIPGIVLFNCILKLKSTFLVLVCGGVKKSNKLGQKQRLCFCLWAPIFNKWKSCLTTKMSAIVSERVSTCAKRACTLHPFSKRLHSQPSLVKSGRPLQYQYDAVIQNWYSYQQGLSQWSSKWGSWV